MTDCPDNRLYQPAVSAPPTLGSLLNSEFFGMWSDRTDIADSVEFARELRAQGWHRSFLAPP